MTQKRLNTRYIKVDPLKPDPGAMHAAGAILAQGGLVAFPTETVYGLGANALNGKAVIRIFEAKERPSDNPMIVHVADLDQVKDLVENLPAPAKALMHAFWPGPLTLVLPVGSAVPSEVTAGLPSVAIRMPGHAVALSLIRAAGAPVAAPSANLSGRPSPTTAAHVLQDLNGRIDMILDGGPAGVGVESTVLDLTGPVPTILRPGGVTLEALRGILGEVLVEPAVLSTLPAARPRSPGMKYTHYAPRAPLLLVEGEPQASASKIREIATEYRSKGKQVGILTYSDSEDYTGSGQVVLAGQRNKPETVAAGLYAALRRFNDLQVDFILAEGLPESGVGLAVMNRLRRAAGGRILHVVNQDNGCLNKKYDE
ncbi:MAG: L-threonylcarbamoyladenylate synthase [Desulfotomaculaceae bacterium]|nr:L-threonylcarbamoyladenylate synthase [Desulfotomaculaceae bacterium]